MAKRLTPSELTAMLQRREAAAAGELQARIKAAQRAIAAQIEGAASKRAIVTSASEREALLRDISAQYEELNRGLDKWMQELTEKTAVEWHSLAARDITRRGAKVVKPSFSRDRVKRYWQIIHPDNQRHLAAVFTDQMQSSDKRLLRSAVVDTFRQQTLEGWTAKETQKQLQSRWDALARNLRGDRFVDASGRPWTNASYIQMLTRTTMQRVSNESYTDTLVENGFDLCRISDDGDPCPICQAWAGVIVSQTGKTPGYPTLKEAIDSGLFHPNCMCRREYVDETVDKAMLKRQAEPRTPKLPPPVDDADANREATKKYLEEMQKYNDTIRIKEKIDAGMSKAEAQADLMRDKIKVQVLSAFPNDPSKQDWVDKIPDGVLLQMKDVPRIEPARAGDEPNSSRDSSLGGVLKLERDGKTEDYLRAFEALERKRGVVWKIEQSESKAVDLREPIKESLKKAGFRNDMIERVDKIPVPVLKRMTEMPSFKVSKSGAYYTPAAHEIHMNGDPKSWSGHPLTFDHEIAHAIHTKTGAIKEDTIDSALKAAIETDYAVWKKAKKDVHGKDWTLIHSRHSSVFANDLAKSLGAESFGQANLDQQHRVSGLLDAVGGMSKGRYGSGHAVAYYKRHNGIQGYKEVYANCYRAIVNKWNEYDKVLPLTTKAIRDSLGI